MRQMGLIFNTRKLLNYFIMLVIGISLMFYGVLSYYEDFRGFTSNLSDEEIIMRARALGMIEVKDLIKDETND